jgi:hypothetical protein
MIVLQRRAGEWCDVLTKKFDLGFEKADLRNLFKMLLEKGMITEREYHAALIRVTTLNIKEEPLSEVLHN